MTNPAVLIIGGGISGLATAYHLQGLVPQATVTLLEANTRVGGTIWTERRGGFQVEIGPNGFLDNKPSTIELCRHIGLEDRLIRAAEAARHRFLFLEGKLQQLPEGPWSFLRSPLLSWRGKWSLLRERFRPPGRGDLDESVHDFLTRRTSKEIAEVLGDALVTGIHAGDPHLLSMAAAFPRIVAMEREHGSILRGMAQLARQRRAEARLRGRSYRPGPQTLTFREGLRLLVETLAEQLKQKPVLGVSIRRVKRSSSGEWIVHGEGQDRWTTKAVVLACPAHQQAQMLAELDEPLAAEIAAIPYSPAVVIALGYRKEDVPHGLDGFGYIAPQRTRADLLGAQWCSSIFPERAPPGMVLLRAIAGGWHRRDVVSWDDDRLLAAVRDQFRLALGIEAAPVFHHIVRWPQAIPQYHVGHLERVARIEALATKHPGLFLTGNAYHGVALNDCTEQGATIADQVRRWLRMNGDRP